MTKFNARGEEVIRSLPGGYDLLEIAQGNIPGVSKVHKFGYNADVDTAATEDVWEGGGTVPLYTSNQSLEIVSSDANDTSAGTGARTITVVTQNLAGTETEQTATMNGTTAVALGTTGVVAYRAWVATSGTGNTNAGTITVRLASAGATVATIAAGNGQTLIAYYRVPVSKTGYLYRWGGSVEGGVTADVTMTLWQFPNSGAWRIMENAFLTNTSPPFFQDLDCISLAALTYVRVQATTSANNTQANASFNLFLVDD